MQPHHRFAGLVVSASALLALALGAGASHAQSPSPSAVAVPGFGDTHTTPGAAERPNKSLRYKVIFDITQSSDDSAKANASLDKVARFMNLLSADGVQPKRGDVAAVIHGKATPIVMSEPAYKARHGGAENPNLELIEQLKQAGVSVRVCSQALASASIAADAVDKRVQVDVAALTTLANLQLRGYALLAD
jgi:intracellular sulfur oxidation DsrE/DsrF family protein